VSEKSEVSSLRSQVSSLKAEVSRLGRPEISEFETSNLRLETSLRLET